MLYIILYIIMLLLLYTILYIVFIASLYIILVYIIIYDYSIARRDISQYDILCNAIYYAARGIAAADADAARRLPRSQYHAIGSTDRVYNSNICSHQRRAV